MRKPIIMQTGSVNEMWPTGKISEVIERLQGYLQDFIPEKPGYSKHSIMGPAGKLLGLVSSSKFGDNVEPYVGYISNVHHQLSKKPLSQNGVNDLKSAVELLIGLRKTCSERQFLRLLSAVDYGVYYKKVKEISERAAAKKEAAIKNGGETD